MSLEHPLLPGDTARATGHPFIKDDRVALVMDENHVHLEEIPFYHPAVVELLKAKSGLSWWTDHDDHLVTIRAIWTGRALCLTEEDPPVELGARLQPTTKSTTTSAPTRPAKHARSRELQKTIYDLSARGTLVSFWVDEHAPDGFIAWATAVDVAPVCEKLLPFYGTSLRIVQSRWDSTTLERIRTVLRSAPSDILCSFGESHGTDHQPLLRATVKVLTPELAEELRDLPPDAFDLEVLIHREP